MPEDQKGKEWEAVFHNLCKLRVLIEIMNRPDFGDHSAHTIQTYIWIVGDMLEETENLFTCLWEQA